MDVTYKIDGKFYTSYLALVVLKLSSTFRGLGQIFFIS